MEEFELNGREFVELCSLLKLLALCPSGGSAKQVIGEGRVAVDGQIESRKRCKIRAGQLVEFDGQQILVV